MKIRVDTGNLALKIFLCENNLKIFNCLYEEPLLMPVPTGIK